MRAAAGAVSFEDKEEATPFMIFDCPYKEIFCQAILRGSCDEGGSVTGQSNIKILGTGTLAEVFGDFVAYRSLEPADQRLPGLTALRNPMGLARGRIPRKIEPVYGHVVVEMLRAAQAVMELSGKIENLVLIGDTEHNDGGAFDNICAALKCPGAAFICDQTEEQPRLLPTDRDDGRTLYNSNRWRLLDGFEADLSRNGVSIGRGTVVIVDIDKTALAARGRNHRPIDQARAAAVFRTALLLRGKSVDRSHLLAAYNHFNQTRFHTFTTDNQDYLAYIALVVEAGWSTIENLHGAIDRGRFGSFDDLLTSISETADRLPVSLRRVHDDVVAAVAAGDPTPFKDFRRSEFRETVDRMSVPARRVEDLVRLLDTRITLTAEVWQRARRWRERGALVFGLSDKPDEASFPPPGLASRGYLPLHRTEALVVGE